MFASDKECGPSLHFFGKVLMVLKFSVFLIFAGTLEEEKEQND